jgi:hypothetical protein
MCLNGYMASIKTNGVTKYSGGGKHGDKRTKRTRTRANARRAAIKYSTN